MSAARMSIVALVLFAAYHLGLTPTLGAAQRRGHSRPPAV